MSTRETLRRALGQTLWICPFRPFFLLAATYAVLTMSVWAALLAGFISLPGVAGGPFVWHAHEMLFGFAMAAIVGFLLTAVPEFTGVTPLERRPLMRLAALWLVGRGAFLLSGVLGIWLAAIADLALLVALIAIAAPPLWRQEPRRHVTFITTLTALALTHAGFWWTLATGGEPMRWLRLALGVLMVLIVVALSRISMRIVNDVLFDRDGEARTPYLARPPRRNLAIATITAYSVGEFWQPGNAVNGWLALAAAAAMANLLNDWHIGRALARRWVLVPYAVYVCMAVGYALIGASLLGAAAPVSAGEHLLLAGALGLAVMIVMTIAGGMHSGHGLDERRWVPLAAAALVAAAVVRTTGGWWALPAAFTFSLAAALWVIGWAIFLRFGMRTLLGARPDGRERRDESPPRD